MPLETTEATPLLVFSYSPHVVNWRGWGTPEWELICAIVQSTVSSKSTAHEEPE